MGKLDKFRKLLALPEVVQSVELTDRLKDLYTDYLELLDENKELKEKLKESEEISNIKRNAKIYSGFYTLADVKDFDGEEIPFCLNCLYEHGKQIPMLFGVVESGLQDLMTGRVFRDNTYGYKCNKCGTKIAITTNKKGEK